MNPLSSTSNEILEVLKYDEQNVRQTTDTLMRFHLLDLYGDIGRLFDLLSESIKNGRAGALKKLLSNQNQQSETDALYTFSLQLQMSLSANVQLVHAAGHLFRGHLTDTFSHARRAIEAAGIAYLSTKEPDLGKVYFEGDRNTFRNKTGTKKILPSDDPLTADLNVDIDFCSLQTHNNLKSLVNAIEQKLIINEEKWKMSFDICFHEVDDNDGKFLRRALRLLRITERILMLFTATFEISDANWQQQITLFSDKVGAAYANLAPMIRIEESNEINTIASK